MIKASALYISLILSMLIVLICGSLLSLGYIYRMENKKQERRDRLEANLASGMAIVLEESFKPDTLLQTGLYGTEGDSVLLDKQAWGVFELGLVKAWENTDTLQKAFLIGAVMKDTLKVLELSDEDRPLSISGKSLIKGTALLPKSGIKAAYVENATYIDKTLVYGRIKDSGRELPEPDEAILKQARKLIEEMTGEDKVAGLLDKDSTQHSFFKPVRKIHLGVEDADLSGLTIKGNVMISCDTTLVLDAASKLDKVILIAPHVRIGEGFKGNIQVIATDSITLGNKVQLDYPSALLVLKHDTAKFQVRIDIGKDCRIAGQVLAYEKARSLLMPMVVVGEGTQIKGEVYVKGYLNLGKKSAVQGSVSLIRFMARTASSLYENYLIDVQLNRPALSRYYLSSKLLNKETLQNKVLCWLW